VSNHLAGNYEAAEKFIHENRDFLVNKMNKIELNEFHLYEATLYRDHGRYKAAIVLLKAYDDSILDKNGRDELLGELFMKLNQNEDAVQCYESLLESNPSNSKFYH
jgi:tetratricopeptide (TPR) repeat protein